MTLSDSEDDVFARAAVEGLHSPPVEPTGPTSRGNRAWVVFNGRNVGVFETWYVLLIENYLLLRNVHVREATVVQVNGFPSGVQRGYNSYNEARSAWLHSCVSEYPCSCSTSSQLDSSPSSYVATRYHSAFMW